MTYPVTWFIYEDFLIMFSYWQVSVYTSRYIVHPLKPKLKISFLESDTSRSLSLGIFSSANHESEYTFWSLWPPISLYIMSSTSILQNKTSHRLTIFETIFFFAAVKSFFSVLFSGCGTYPLHFIRFPENLIRCSISFTSILIHPYILLNIRYIPNVLYSFIQLRFEEFVKYANFNHR